VAHDNFCVSPNGNVSACHEVADERQPFAGRFFYGRPSAADAGYEFDEGVYTFLRAQPVEHRAYCRDCFARWNCAGDCYHKSLHASTAEFAGAGRCEISRQLTRDQLVENIAAAVIDLPGEGQIIHCPATTARANSCAFRANTSSTIPSIPMSKSTLTGRAE